MKKTANWPPRWDAPFIITTSVRFFEGLFSCQPKDCRKLHQIAQSVILFDEAQSLPTDLMTATVQTADALCRDYGCTVVLSTATQPDFSALQGVQCWQPKEIIPKGKSYYEALKRVNAVWKLEEPTPLKRIAAEMLRQDNACAIVNLRRHAADLFQELKQHAPAEELFFLTTDLCPAHRSAVISAIKARQKQGLCCRVVATQCIEAGVDLDFHAMYRPWPLWRRSFKRPGAATGTEEPRTAASSRYSSRKTNEEFIRETAIKKAQKS